MRPSIAPDDEFSKALNSSRCPFGIDKSEELFSGYMIALDGVNALCVISYGTRSVSETSVDRCTSYATLTFIEINPSFYREECGSNIQNFDYANEKIDGERVATRYLKAKVMQSAQFVIKTSSLHTWGQIKACFC
ncbi:hypothetical protein AgCh_035753 [Apium graveolens]